jgi:hypothetical protein
MTIEWAAVSAISDVLGVALVAPSLVYLALQVRQNTAQMRASAAHQYLDTSKDLNLALIENKELASVYRRGVGDFMALDEDEKTQFVFYVGHYYQAFATIYDLWTDKTLPDSAWRLIKKHIIAMQALPGMRHVWDTWARSALSEEFTAYVESIAGSGEATYSLESILTGAADTP